MRLYKFFWDTHKWTGIVLALVFLNVAVTGFFLLIKKRADWIQPPTQKGQAGDVEDFISIQKLIEVVLAHGHEDFRTLEDIDRVDFRPGKRVHKVLSVHHHSELQVDAVTGEILSEDWRVSDLLEDLHDGSFFGDWVHDWFMLLTPVGLVFLVGTGFYLWLDPVMRRRKKKAGRAT